MEENWFIFKGDHHLGPFTSKKLLAMYHGHEVSENVLVWREGNEAWRPIKDCPEFKKSLYTNEKNELPPLPPLPMEEENHPLYSNIENVDDLLADTHELEAQDLEPLAQEEAAKDFWEQLGAKPEPSKKYHAPFEHVPFEEEEKIEIEEEEVPPPLPPLPLDSEPELEPEREPELEPETEPEPILEVWDLPGVEEEKDTSDLNDVEADQARREKRVERIIRSVWGFACLGFILISLYLAVGSKQRKEHFTGLTKASYQKLSKKAYEARGSTLDGIKFDLGVSTGEDDIWMAFNRKGPAGLFLSMKSIDQNVMSLDRVVVSSTSELEDGVAHFDKFDMVEGVQFSPGMYELHLQVFNTSLKHRFLLFLKKVPLIGSLPFISSIRGAAEIKKQVLFWGGNPDDFKKKLASFQEKNKEFKARPIQQRIESFSTLNSLLTKIYTVYEGVLPKMKKGGDITLFEKEYGTTIAPLLQGIILDNIKKQRQIKGVDPKGEREYDKLVMFGRRVGEYAADIVTETRALKKLSRKRKVSLTKKIKAAGISLEKEGLLLIRENEVRLKEL